MQYGSSWVVVAMLLLTVCSCLRHRRYEEASEKMSKRAASASGSIWAINYVESSNDTGLVGVEWPSRRNGADASAVFKVWRTRPRQRKALTADSRFEIVAALHTSSLAS
jgi:hypothetical protein